MAEREHRRTTRGFVSAGRLGEAVVCGAAFALLSYLGPFVAVEGPTLGESLLRGVLFGVVWYLVTAAFDSWRGRRAGSRPAGPPVSS